MGHRVMGSVVLSGLGGCGIVLTSGSPQEGRLLTNLKIRCRMEALPSISRSCPRALQKTSVPLCVSERGTSTCHSVVRPSRLVVATSAVI